MKRRAWLILIMPAIFAIASIRTWGEITVSDSIE
jgi:hypothetical protein